MNENVSEQKNEKPTTLKLSLRVQQILIAQGMNTLWPFIPTTKTDK